MELEQLPDGKSSKTTDFTLLRSPIAAVLDIVVFWHWVKAENASCCPFVAIIKG